MPQPTLGSWVYFYAHDGAKPVPALVTDVGSRTLILWAVAPGYGGTEKQSVHHVTDPGMNEFPEWKRYGLWDFQPKDPTLAILSERLSLLEKKMAALAPKKA